MNVVGIVPIDLLAILRALETRGFFTMDEYNIALEDLGYPSYERNDKPCLVPTLRSKNISKLRGKAVSHLVHIRNFPLVLKRLGKNIDPDDPIVELGLLLHSIVERATANEFFHHEIDILEDEICDFYDKRREAREQYENIFPRPKPKHHYLMYVLCIHCLDIGDGLMII